ncbi:MAG: isocitrate lyase/phosphoenolpyruvate mutase family protein [Pyrinomonadaceae bacterium]
MKTQAEKGKIFRALHERDGAFIIPNPWDAGTARLLELAGFEAIASTSAGYAFSVAKRDGEIGRDEMIDHIRTLAAATDLPVSADLENGYGDDAGSAAETIRLAAAAGCVGGSIEDVTSRGGETTIYNIEHAADRVRAAVEASRSLGFSFTLTARAENFIADNPDLDDTIKRLQAYQEAGADVLFAPGIVRRADIETIIGSIDRPLNVIMGLEGVTLNLADLSSMWVKRVSVGSCLTRVAYGAFLRAANEMREHGTFSFAEQAVPYQKLDQMFG